MSSSKKIYLERDFAADDYLSETLPLYLAPYPPPLTYTLYTYSHREGGGGGEES